MQYRKYFLPLALSLLALNPFGYAQGKLCRSAERVGFIKGFYFTINNKKTSLK